MITYRVPARSAQANQPHKIRILHIVDFVVGHQKTYFQTVIQELQEQPVPDSYLDYLRLQDPRRHGRGRRGESPKIYVFR